MRNGRRSDYQRTMISREIRLWVATIITALAFIETHPEVKNKIREKYDDFMNRFRKNPEIKYYPPTNKN